MYMVGGAAFSGIKWLEHDCDRSSQPGVEIRVRALVPCCLINQVSYLIPVTNLIFMLRPASYWHFLTLKCIRLLTLLGAFAQSRTAPITFVTSVCPSIGLSTYISAVPAGWIFMTFDSGDFCEKLLTNPNLVKIGQKYRALYMKT
jgi:hypothetical protein